MKIAVRRLSLMLAWLMLMMLVIIIMPAASFATQPTDITDHWAKDHINDWVEKGLISGYSDGTFKPDNNITRAEFMALVNRAFGFEDKAEINYSDVPADQWVTDVVATAKAAGYISGYGDGTIKPNNPITRQEAAVIISRIIKLESNTEVADQFSDTQDIPQWSKGSVGAVAHAKIMQGYGDGSFKAGNYIKRAECVVSLNRAMNYKVADAPIVTTPSTTSRSSGGGGGGGGGGAGNGDGDGKEPPTTIANVATEAELNSAIKNSNIKTINFTKNIVADIEVTRLVNTINFGSYKLNGSLDIDTTTTGTMTLRGTSTPSITGNLTVKTPKATITNKIMVGGNVYIKAVAPNSWHEEANGNNLDVSATNASINIIGQVNTLDVNGTVTINITGTVNNATFNISVVVTGANGILSAVINAAGVKLDEAPQQTTLKEGVTVEIDGQQQNNEQIAVTNATNAVAKAEQSKSQTDIDTAQSLVTSLPNGDNKTKLQARLDAIQVAPTPVGVESVALNQTSTSVNVGASITLVATVEPSNATNKTVTWSTSNSKVATVDNNGKVTGVNAGTATITVTAKDGGKTAECLVTVTDPSIVEIISVTPIADIINIPRGKAKEELNLPTQVEVTITGGAKKTVDVVWDDGTLGVTWIKDIITYNPNQAGTFTFIGGLKGLPAGVTNPHNMTANVKVIVLRSLEDNTPPVIKLLGNDPVSINVNNTYEDAGAVALDDNSGDITDKIVRTIVIDATGGNRDAVDTSEGCNYTIKYNVMDDLGNKAKEVTRKVIVVEKVRKITVTAPQGITSAFQGETLQMQALVERQTATNKEVAWSVENGTGTATISEDGLLTAIDEGTVTVKATAKDGSSVVGTLEITIYAKTTTIPVKTVELDQLSQIIAKGGEFPLIATVKPANATNPAVTWSSSDPAVATVDDSGKVTGVNAGKATITVTTVDGGKEASCEVTVYDGILEVTRITAPFRADATGGDKLEYAYAVGKLTISAPIAEIPSVKNPSGVEAKWIGVNIPKPVVDVAESGTIHLTIKEIGTQDKVHADITYGEEDPFLYYFGAEAGGRTLNLEMVWNGTHKETLVIEYVDSTVVGEEPLEIVEVSFWNKDLNQILIKTNRLCSNVNYQKFSIDGVNADSYGQPGDYKTTYGFWIGFPKDKLTIGEFFTLIVPAGAITDIYGATNKELTFVIGTPTEKITPVVNEAVTATAVNVGQTLAASTLSGTFKNADNEAVAGKLAWDAPDTEVGATGDFAWTFTPNNTTKYNVVKGTVSVTVLIPVTVTVETTKSSTEFIVNLSPAVTGLTKDNFILKLGQNPVEIADVQGAGGSQYWLTTASLVRKQTYTLTINNAGYHFGNPIEVIIPGAGTISGNVKDFDDSGALLDVKVEVYDDVIVGEGKTDAEGNYIITDIIEGIYNVTFSKEGYQSETITGVKVNNNETTVKGVDLEKSQGQTHSITIAGGTDGVSVNKEIAAEGEEVTVWIANIESGKEFNSITVTDSDGGAVATKGVETGKQYTFIMPAKSVTITVKLQTVAGAPAAPAEGEITIIRPQEDAAIGQTLITMAETLEFRITNGTGEVVKQDWTPGTGEELTTTANPALVAGDKLEVRVKAVPPIPAGNIYTYAIKEDDIGAASANATIAIAAVETLENYVAGFQSGNYTRKNWLHAHGIDSTDNGSLRMNAIIARNKLLENSTRAVLTSRIGAVEEVLRKYDILLTEFEASKFDEKYKLNNPLTKDVQQIVKRYTSGQWNTSVRYDWLTQDSDVAYILEYDKLDICNLVILRPDNNQGNVTTELNLNMTLKDPITSREYVLKHSFNIEIAEFTADEQIAMNNIINKVDAAIDAYKAAFPDGVYDETRAEELREPGSAYETAQDALMDFGRDESDPVGYYGNLGSLQPLAERLYSIERLVLSMEVITAYIEGDEELEEPGIGPISDEYIILSPGGWELPDNMMATWITEPSGFIEIEVGDYVEGNITRPTLGEPDAEVTLTLTLSLNGLVLENNFVLTVLAINPLEALEIQDVAAESTENNGTVSVRWTPLTEQQIIDTGAVGYRIFYNDGTSSYGSVDVDNAREATCTIEGLIVGREYEIIVVAYNDDFYSIWPEGPYAKVTVNE